MEEPPLFVIVPALFNEFEAIVLLFVNAPLLTIASATVKTSLFTIVAGAWISRLFCVTSALNVVVPPTTFVLPVPVIPELNSLVPSKNNPFVPVPLFITAVVLLALKVTSVRLIVPPTVLSIAVVK